MTEVTLNQNIAECLKNTGDFGSTTVHNICTGASTVVPWGSADWAGASVLIALGFGVVFVFGVFGAVMIRDRFFW